MRSRLQLTAAIGRPAGRVRMVVLDEIDPWPADSSADALILDHARRAVRPWEVSMLLREKGKKDAEPVSYGWDEAQAALQAGTHEVVTAGDGKDTPTPVAEKPVDDDLDGKTKAELEALAKERGIDISAAKTKDDIVKAVRAAR